MGNFYIARRGSIAAQRGLAVAAGKVSNFAGAVVGTFPADWTLHWKEGANSVAEIAVVDNRKTLRLRTHDFATTSSTIGVSLNDHNLTWADNGFDFKALVKCDVFSHDHAVSPCHGLDGTAHGNQYDRAVTTVNGNNNVRFFEHDNGAGTWLGSGVSGLTVTAGDWVWMRFRVPAGGTSMQAKVWFEGDPEPGTWIDGGGFSNPTTNNVGFFQTRSDVYITWASVVAHGEDHPAADIPSVIMLESWSGVSGANDGSGSMLCPAPSGIEVGDLLVYHLSQREVATIVPAGWTTIFDQSKETLGTAHGVRLAYRIATVDDVGATYEFRAHDGSTHRQGVVVARMTGHNPASPIGSADVIQGETTVDLATSDGDFGWHLSQGVAAATGVELDTSPDTADYSLATSGSGNGTPALVGLIREETGGQTGTVTAVGGNDGSNFSASGAVVIQPDP